MPQYRPNPSATPNVQNGYAPLDSGLHVPLANLSGITTSQLSASAGIVDGQIAVPHGQELAYVQATVTFDSSSGAYVDITGMAIALTMPSYACWVEFWCTMAYSTAGQTELDIQILDVTGLAQVALGAVNSVGATEGGGQVTVRAKVNPGAGSRTYKAQFKNTAAIASHVFASATSPMYLRVYVN